MTGEWFESLLPTIAEHACSGTSNVGRILIAKSHPNHNATRTVSAQLSHGNWSLIRHEQMTPPAYSTERIRRG